MFSLLPSAGAGGAVFDNVHDARFSDSRIRNFAEFTLKEFEGDKEGNWIDEIPDGNDHSIDAVRYAMLDDCLRG